jgi:hypothetical protein
MYERSWYATVYTASNYYFLSLWGCMKRACIMFVHFIHGIVPPLISWLFHFDKNENLISVLTRVIKFCYRWHAPSRQLASPLGVELPAISLPTNSSMTHLSWRVWDAYALVESAQLCRLSGWNGAPLLLSKWAVGGRSFGYGGSYCSSLRWWFWVDRLAFWVSWQDRWRSHWQGSIWDTKGHHGSFSSGVGSRPSWSLSEG